MRLLLLDNEAVNALGNVAHPRHRIAVAHLQGAAARRRKAVEVRVIVPTAVRVEAGWDRSRPATAAINRFRSHDAPLDAAAANVAAGILSRTGVSVADAHLGAVIHSHNGHEIVVLTSDPGDMRRVAAPVVIRPVRV